MDELRTGLDQMWHCMVAWVELCSIHHLLKEEWGWL